MQTLVWFIVDFNIQFSFSDLKKASHISYSLETRNYYNVDSRIKFSYSDSSKYFNTELSESWFKLPDDFPWLNKLFTELFFRSIITNLRQR